MMTDGDVVTVDITIQDSVVYVHCVESSMKYALILIIIFTTSVLLTRAYHHQPEDTVTYPGLKYIGNANER